MIDDEKDMVSQRRNAMPLLTRLFYNNYPDTWATARKIQGHIRELGSMSSTNSIS